MLQPELKPPAPPEKGAGQKPTWTCAEVPCAAPEARLPVEVVVPVPFAETAVIPAPAAVPPAALFVRTAVCTAEEALWEPTVARVEGEARPTAWVRASWPTGSAVLPARAPAWADWVTTVVPVLCALGVAGRGVGRGGGPRRAGGDRFISRVPGAAAPEYARGNYVETGGGPGAGAQSHRDVRSFLRTLVPATTGAGEGARVWDRERAARGCGGRWGRIHGERGR